VSQPGDERRERRLIDVTPSQMLAGLEEVELVAVPPVPRRDREEDQRGRRGYEGEGSILD
jgi:hypothetical protein